MVVVLHFQLHDPRRDVNAIPQNHSAILYEMPISEQNNSKIQNNLGVPAYIQPPRVCRQDIHSHHTVSSCYTEEESDGEPLESKCEARTAEEKDHSQVQSSSTLVLYNHNYCSQVENSTREDQYRPSCVGSMGKDDGNRYHAPKVANLKNTIKNRNLKTVSTSCDVSSDKRSKVSNDVVTVKEACVISGHRFVNITTEDRQAKPAVHGENQVKSLNNRMNGMEKKYRKEAYIFKLNNMTEEELAAFKGRKVALNLLRKKHRLMSKKSELQRRGKQNMQSRA